MRIELSAIRTSFIPAFAACALLFILSRYNYLVFHTAVEFFSIIVILSISIFVWNVRRSISNNYILFLSTAFLFVGLLDFMHTIAYKGMNLLPISGANPATQLWIAARALQSVSLLIAAFLIHARLNFKAVFAAYTAATVLFVLSIFYWLSFPDCYIEGAGLTPFKKISEYVISLILAFAAVLLYKKRAEFDEDVSRLLIAAITVTVAMELTFTLYADVYGYLNFTGHMLKILSFYLFYKALIKTGFEKPYSIIFRDLKEKEKELTKSHDFIKSALDSMNDAVSIINTTDYSIVDCNSVFLKETGLKKEEVVGKKCYEITHRRCDPCEAPNDICPMEDTLKTGEHSVYEHIHFDGSGNQMNVEVSASPITDENGNVVQIVHVSRNISERKSAEKRIRQLNTDLEKQVDELQKAKEIAETSALARSRFLANMSHELRTPMNAIIGMADLALDTHLTAEQKEYLTVISHASKSLLKILNDILNLSKIESGKLELEEIVFDLKSVITDSLSIVSLAASEKGVALNYSVSAETPQTLKGDPERLKQILVNLLGNAVKFTDKGEISVHVKEMPSEKSEKRNRHPLLFSVHDTGIGIPIEKQKCIFDDFAQADESTTKKYGGTGLGLAISKKLAELMSGNVWVESEPQRGATFYFTAVFNTADASGTEEHLSCKQDSTAELKESIPLKILIAEDNDFNQMLAVRLLEKLGHTVTVAENGLKAIEQLEKELFDLVLMDIQMPEMDGLTATRIIRNTASKVLDHKVPIVAMTANAMREDREQCLAAGMNDYISKPISMQELAHILSALNYSTKEDVADLVHDKEKEPIKDTRTVIDIIKLFEYVGFEIVGNNEEFIVKIIDAFRNSSSERLITLNRSFEAGDLNTLEREAHTLKSMAASIGAETLKNIASDIENASRNKQLVPEQTITSLKAELQKVLNILSQIA
ncbi:MAG: response regulator [Nitrospirae bacterium]|uniref:Sensory/regulatory protein RpfC n=1 Tax=uncultured Nitrospirota bacterium TaxID=170969 RepID=A0A142BTS8_9BACT|nr:multi-sensor hybrid histidine kinase [uncultured Nitrospirota bacterium]MBF0328626.1 response regulator [Nitrospirota bacterium]